MGSVAGRHSVRSHATEDGKVSSSKSESSHNEGDGVAEDGNTGEDKGGIETSSDGQVASDGKEGQECTHTQDILASISQVFGGHEDTDPESDPGEKIQSVRWKWHPKSPKEDSPWRNPVNHCPLRRSHQLMRHSTTGPGKKHACLTHALRLGVTTKLPKASQAGWQGTL